MYIQVDTPACTTAPTTVVRIWCTAEFQASGPAWRSDHAWCHKYIIDCIRNVFLVPNAQILGTLYCLLSPKNLGTFEANQGAEQVTNVLL